MKPRTKYLQVLLFISYTVFVSTCKDSDIIPENIVCYEDEPCVLDNDCNTILAPRGALIGSTYDINGDTYTIVCNLTLREMINNGGDLSKVITTHVTNMSGLFIQSSDFNQDISSWDLRNVTNTAQMFLGVSSFNQDISCWDVSNVTDMGGMFNGASSFNQDLSSWNVDNVTSCNEFATEAVSWTQSKPDFTNCEL